MHRRPAALVRGVNEPRRVLPCCNVKLSSRHEASSSFDFELLLASSFLPFLHTPHLTDIHPSAVHLTASVCLIACLLTCMFAAFLLASAFRFLLSPLCTCLEKHQTNKGVSTTCSPTQLRYASLLFLLSHIDSGKDCLRQDRFFR
ncbi:hypothetical protein J3458_000640 [Metarhizium acridum]|uniref:uncharacterized protein n=1 Tax=Metarhizium acridum TaxID=92637 RepID=UPI001C6D2193|nr:hypothetical protein J3458_000640 [Metarhizium acridum]